MDRPQRWKVTVALSIRLGDAGCRRSRRMHSVDCMRPVCRSERKSAGGFPDTLLDLFAVPLAVGARPLKPSGDTGGTTANRLYSAHARRSSSGKCSVFCLRDHGKRPLSDGIAAARRGGSHVPGGTASRGEIAEWTRGRESDQVRQRMGQPLGMPGARSRPALEQRDASYPRGDRRRATHRRSFDPLWARKVRTRPMRIGRPRPRWPWSSSGPRSAAGGGCLMRSGGQPGRCRSAMALESIRVRRGP
jgi:hypothetical protein